MLTRLTLASLLLASAVDAQNFNIDQTSNNPYYVVCTCTFPATARQRIWMGACHPNYNSPTVGGVGGGVPAGTREFKIFKEVESQAAPQNPARGNVPYFV